MGKLQVRAIHAPATSVRKIPATRAPYNDPASLLKVSARNLEQYASKPLFSSWDQLFSATSMQMSEAGLNVKERRYLMWLLEKYRQGHDPAQVAVATPPKKKIRGWGPKVQFGKRVR